ncbi:unnamed protein product [Dimorphilus gyrociliatus]|uniref:BPL/LPL catalytic domain-containing protein n=1 Tax=Dimorphilus gyrociliatus TaxID=2664684 RepID=A0A7I8V4A1_9ANNE|nr:unnamed protein product [Dimorphilus gyrociliatus]
MNGKLGNSLLLWQNHPCVVIGRHQNPWLECDISYLERNKIPIARRKSGGGAVYHDLGNLNCTFYTSRKEYDRPKNLKLICSAVQDMWPDLDIYPTDRDDIEMFGYKVSGTASKLDREHAYHHLTLLVNADLLNMSMALKNKINIESKSTKSIRSQVTNLTCSMAPSLNMESIIDCISRKVSPQSKVEIIDPNEVEGVKYEREKIKSWNWIYGFSPAFTIVKDFNTSLGLHHLTIKVVKGKISDFKLLHKEINYPFLNEILIGSDFRPDVIEQTLEKFIGHELCELIIGYITGSYDDL